MNGDIGDLLHESIGRLGAGERVPAGLADQVLWRERQRRIRLRAAMATGTAGVAAVAVLAATAFTSGAARHPGELPAQTTGYVLSRAEHALDSAEHAGLIQEIDASGHHAYFYVPTRLCHRGEVADQCIGPQYQLQAPEAEIWTYHGRLRQEGFTASGKLEFDAATTIVTTRKGSTATGEVINYHARTWWRALTPQPALTEPTAGCPVFLAPDGVMINWVAAIRAALACRAFHIAGHQRIGNINAIKLVSPYSGPSQELWIDASTYLPVRVAWAWPDGFSDGPGSLVGDFRWLQPTKANLASLTVRIPRGFRRTPPGGLGQPAFASTTEIRPRPRPRASVHMILVPASPSPRPTAS